MSNKYSRRSFTKLAVAAAGVVSMPAIITSARAAETVRIGLPTKNYWGTVLAKVAESQGFFKKEGVTVDVAIYRSGAECVQALAAGAADIVETGASSVAIGKARGINAKIVAGASVVPAGWILMANAKSPIQSVKDLQGKKVGITSAGSFSEVLAKWVGKKENIAFDLVPLGGGGMVPNLLAGNIDAAVLYPPVSFVSLVAKETKTILDYALATPPAMSDGWVATDQIITENPSAVQKALNALFGAVQVLRNDRVAALKLLEENIEVSREVAEVFYEKSILTLLQRGEIEQVWIDNVLDMARLGGATEMAPAEAIFTTQFTPVPTQA